MSALFALSGPACQPSATQVHECREITARTFQLERIVDGDTFVIIYDGEPTYVRVFRTNGPEKRDGYKGDYGRVKEACS